MFPLIGIFNRLYFNPRSHERSDFGSSTSTSMNTISIHAPTRGATYNGSVANGLSGISIHAPTRGATPGFFLIAKFTYISIHAPTRGATFSLNEVLRCPDISIHAPTRGATVPASASHSSVVFQSTLPREERPGSFPAAVGLMLHFNPRSHERSDPVTLFCDYQGGFQSTLPREERPRFDAVCQVSASFQSTLPREERQSSPRLSCQSYYFNPRSHERSDVSLVVTSIESAISIHAPTRGATGVYCYSRPSHKFQSTLPREERQ